MEPIPSPAINPVATVIQEGFMFLSPNDGVDAAARIKAPFAAPS
jgi:hypothetical protein